MMSEKLAILASKMVEHEFEIVYILTAAKNYTSNFSDTPLHYIKYKNVLVTKYIMYIILIIRTSFCNR